MRPKLNTCRTKLLALALLPILAGGLGAAALAADDIVPAAGTLRLRAVAEVKIVKDLADGTRSVQRVPAETVVPGDEVIYTLVYDNQGAVPAENISITNPIPEHMEFRRAAAGPTWLKTVYSVDGGHVFGALSELTVTDGAGQNRQALPQDCTHIRWQFTRSLAPGETGQVSYITRLL